MRWSWLTIRFGMILTWLGLIAFFLSIPYLATFLRTEKSINVLTWTELIDSEMVKQFERQTGIKVYRSYFEGNEELYARMKATEGKGYDLIIPSDYIVQQLIAADLLKPLDKTQLTMWHRLDPKLLGQYYDPENTYTIPYFWALYGLAVDTRAFGGIVPEATWSLLFDKYTAPSCIVMPDAAREVILLAAYYLFGSIENLTSQKIEKITELLLQQKTWVSAYSEMRADFLLTTGVCPVIVSQGPLIWRIMQQQKHIAFVVPREGTFVVIDNLVLPKATQKDEYVYKFINFMYKPEHIKNQFFNYRFFPATIDLPQLLGEIPGIRMVQDAYRQTKRFLFFKNVLTDQQMNEIWIALKGS